MHRSGWFAILLVFLTLGWLASRFGPPISGSTPPRSPSQRPIPLAFERNEGQAEPEVRFLARGAGFEARITARNLTLVSRSGPSAGATLVLEPSRSGTEPRLEATDPLPGLSSYFLGDDPSKWVTRVPTFARVIHREIYAGVDLVYHGDPQGVRYDVVLAPGTDPAAVTFELEGADAMEIDAEGGLILRVGAGRIEQGPPALYQEDEGKETEARAGYRLLGNDEVGFFVGSYDRSRPAVIRVPSLRPVGAATGLLGQADDDPALAIDPAGNAYVAGRVHVGESAAIYVAKLDPSAGSVLYTAYLGGEDDETPHGIAVDAAGSAYVAGSTRSRSFPTVRGIQTRLGGESDAFVLKIGPDGSRLVYSTYLGGEAHDVASGLAVDPSGSAHVVGTTASTAFPTFHPFQASLRGTTDAFVAKLVPEGSALAHSSYLGGEAADTGQGIAVDTSGSAYVIGTTRSATFPTVSPIQPAPGGAADAFVAKVSSADATLVFSTYLGGEGDDEGHAIVVDAFGGIHVAGATRSAAFPTVSPLQPLPGGAGDAFVAGLDGETSALLYSTYLGGPGVDVARAIAAEARGGVYVTGWTDGAGFPTTSDAPRRLPRGAGEAFVTRIEPSGSSASHSTYLGGSGRDLGSGIAVAPSGGVHLVGTTTSTDEPAVTPLPPTAAGGTSFIARVSPEAPSPRQITCTKTFDDGDLTGRWEIPANWDPDGLPGAADNACIGTAFTVILSSGTHTINALEVTSAAAFTITGGSLSIASASTIGSGGFTQSGGTLTGTGSLDIAGLFTWTGGTESGSGATACNGGISVSGADQKTLDARSLGNNGTATWTDDGDIEINLGVFSNEAGSTFDIQNDRSMLGSGTFNNAGTFTKSAGTQTTIIGVAFSNTGTVQALSGKLSFSESYAQTAGATIVNGGILESSGFAAPFGISGGTVSGIGTLDSDIDNTGGVMAPGLSPGILDMTDDDAFFDRSYTQGAAGSFDVELGGLTAGNGTGFHDQLTVSGIATLAGTLNVSLFGGFSPAGGDSFTILTCAALPPCRTGTFATTNFPPAPPGFEWIVSYADSSVDVGLAALPAADLSLAKSDSPDPVPVGNSLTYTIAVSNAGPDPATGVSVTDTLDGDLTFVSASGAGWLCVEAAGTVICTRASLTVGPAPDITIEVTPTPAAAPSVSNTASVTAAEFEPEPANNSDTVATTVSPVADLSLTKSDDPDPVAADGTLTYTLGVSNAGPSDATSLTVTDTLPAGVTFVKATGTDWSCGEAGGVVTCTRATLPVGAAPDITIVLTAPATPGSITNDASVTATELDPTTPNTASETTNVTAVADLSIVKSDGPDPVNAAATLTYTLSVENTGPSDATSLTVTDTLPAGVTFVDFTGTGWSCGESGGVVTCTRAALAVGTAPDITIAVTAPSEAGPIVNDASLTAAEFDPTTPNAASATTTVTPVADLSLAKSDGPDPVDPAATLTYTLSVTNNGPSEATSLTVTDTLPAGVAFVNATGTDWSCGESGGVVTCTRPDLPVGPAPAITITVTAPGAGATLSNTASVASTVADPSPGNDADTEATTVRPPADLSISKGDGPDPVDAATSLTYTLDVTNLGPEAASELTVTDTLPAGVVFLSASGPDWSCGESGGVVTCTRPDLPVGPAPQITITVTAPGSGSTINNDASVSAAGSADLDTSNNSASATTTVTPIADLSVAKTDSPDPVGVSSTLTYTVTVSNAGPSAATSVIVTDTLSAGAAFQSVSFAGWSSCSAPGPGGSGDVICQLFNLPVGPAPPITITVTTPVAPGTLTNPVAVSASESDPVPGNNSDSETTTVIPAADLSIAKGDSPDPVNAGATLTYTLGVSNAGPSDATSLTVTDTLPAGVTFVNATGTDWSCGEAAGVVTCTRATLPVGAAPDITIALTAPATPGSITNDASVAATELDPTTPNTASATTNVTAVTDLSIAKGDNPDPVNAGATLTYTLGVSNAGPSTATAIVISDTLPAGVTFVSATGSGWSCVESGGVVTCSRGSLDPGPAPSITVAVTAPAEGGTLSNSVTVGSTTSDPTPGNNADSETTTVTPVANLSIGKIGSPDPVPLDDDLTYVLSVSNAGPSTATSIAVSDTLPAGVTFVSATGSGWSCVESGGVVTCSRGSLAPGPAPSITIVVTAPSAEGAIVNTASVASDVSDPVPANNAASDTVTVSSPCGTIPQLMAEVEAAPLSTRGKLRLNGLLRAAQGAVARRQGAAGVRPLLSFLREVRALRATGRLDPLSADALISCAETILQDLFRGSGIAPPQRSAAGRGARIPRDPG